MAQLLWHAAERRAVACIGGPHCSPLSFGIRPCCVQGHTVMHVWKQPTAFYEERCLRGHWLPHISSARGCGVLLRNLPGRLVRSREALEALLGRYQLQAQRITPIQVCCGRQYGGWAGGRAPWSACPLMCFLTG